MFPHTGQISLDVLVASAVLVSIAAVFLATYVDYAGEGAIASYEASCLLKAIRASDFLLHSVDGLAVDRHGLVPGNVVDCSRVDDAYTYLSSRGFTGYIACGPFSAGSTDVQIVLRREVVWNGTPVTVEVGVCP